MIAITKTAKPNISKDIGKYDSQPSLLASLGATLYAFAHFALCENVIVNCKREVIAPVNEIIAPHTNIIVFKIFFTYPSLYC
jgi:hypothetical protein